MKILAVILLTAMTAAGFGQNDCPSRHCEPRSQLALDYMTEHFGKQDSALDVWMDNRYSPADRIELERTEHRYEQLEAWARKLGDAADRQAYLAAIEFYEDGLKEAYSEWHTHALQKTQAAYEKHLRECDQEARRSAASRPLPKPPNALVPR